MSMRTVRERLDVAREIDSASLVPSQERHRRSITEVGLGGVIRFEGSTYRVTAVGRYDEYDEQFRRQLDFTSTEFTLFCLDTGQVHHLEWEQDDRVDIALTIAECRISDLRDDENGEVDEDDIEKGEDVLTYEGTTFNLEDDWVAKYYRDATRSSKDAERVSLYEYEARDGTMLTIEEWTPLSGKGESDYRVYVSRSLDPSAIEVLAVSQA